MANKKRKIATNKKDIQVILFETLAQIKILLYLIIFGFLSGILFDICYLISFLCNDNKIVKSILQFVTTTLCFLVLFVINNKLNYGIFRIYIFIIFFAFLFLERVTLGKIFAKTRNWCYTTFVKIVKSAKEKFNGKRKEKTKNNDN